MAEVFGFAGASFDVGAAVTGASGLLGALCVGWAADSGLAATSTPLWVAGARAVVAGSAVGAIGADGALDAAGAGVASGVSLLIVAAGAAGASTAATPRPVTTVPAVGVLGLLGVLSDD